MMPTFKGLQLSDKTDIQQQHGNHRVPRGPGGGQPQASPWQWLKRTFQRNRHERPREAECPEQVHTGAIGFGQWCGQKVCQLLQGARVCQCQCLAVPVCQCVRERDWVGAQGQAGTSYSPKALGKELPS